MQGFLKNRSRKEKGFTLVEGIFASLTILLAISGILASYFTLNNAAILSANRTQALMDAQLVMEQLRATQSANPEQFLSNATLAPGGISWNQWVGGIKAASGLSMLPGENIAVTPPAVPAWSGNGLQVIRIDVSWNGPGQPFVRLVSLFNKRPYNT